MTQYENKTAKMFTTTLVAALGVFALACPAYALQKPQVFEPQGVASNLAGATGDVLVSIVLKGQPLFAAAQDKAVRRAIQGPTTAQLRAEVRADLRTKAVEPTERRFLKSLDSERTKALHEIGAQGNEITLQQAPLVEAIATSGGEIVRTGAVPSEIVARIPAAAIPPLALRPEVQSIEKVELPKPLLNISDHATGATTFWAAGNTGGTGASDSSPSDMAIEETAINENSAAFAGVSWLHPGTGCVSTDDHGTSVTGVIASTDATNRGIAYGGDKVLNACDGVGTWSPQAWELGIDYNGTPGVSDPAEVINVSSGSEMNEGEDDEGTLRSVDYVTSAHNVTYVAGAGNAHDDVPIRGKVEINSPSAAYNAISAAATNDASTNGFSDDFMADYSSRGPTPGGRKKPDIASMGGAGGGGGRWLRSATGSGSPTFSTSYSGTSYSSPHVAAGALLLAGAGVSDSKARKAILIDSAYNMTGVRAECPNGPTAWCTDVGWGILDLTSAYSQRNNYISSSVGGGAAKFFSASLSSGDKATLVWNRRAYNSTYPICCTTAYTLSNLNLYQLDVTTGATQQSSASTIDNVEQVRSGAAGNSIYKVKAASSIDPDGLSAEPFAIAATQPLTPLATPTVNQAPSLSTSATQQGQDVTLGVTVTNNGNLAISGADTTLAVPSGVSLVSGSATQTVGGSTLEPDEHATASWTVRGTADGSYSLPVSAAATGYGETFTSSSSKSLMVDSTAPSASVTPLNQYDTDGQVELSWSGSDGSGTGVDSYDVQVKESSGGWLTLLDDTHLTSTTYSGQDGKTYAFRTIATDAVGNSGDPSTAAVTQTTVDTQTPSLSVSGPASVDQNEPVTYNVAASDTASGIASQSWQVSGSLASGFSGSSFTVPGSLTSSPGGKTVTVTATDGAGRTTTKQVGLTVNSPTTAKRGAALTITKVKRTGRTVTLRGKLAAGATGKVRLARVTRVKSMARQVKIVARWTRRSSSVVDGRWSVSVQLARPGRYRLQVTFAGSRSFDADRAFKRVTVKR